MSVNTILAFFLFTFIRDRMFVQACFANKTFLSTFRFFPSTFNINLESASPSTLDHALLNRFNQVAIHYPPEDKESLLLQKRFGLDKRTSDALVKIVSQIRNNQDLSKDISTRQLFEVAELVADGYKPVDAFKWSVLQQFEGNDIDGGEKSTVLSIIQSL